MPTYEYACDGCGHQFEEFQSITAKPLRKCPACGKPRLRRLIGVGAGVLFKGSGFYETDYRSESYKKAAEAEKSASTSSTGGDAKKGETTTKGESAAGKSESATPGGASAKGETVNKASGKKSKKPEKAA